MSTREKLAAAALRLFVAKGVAGTTTRDIATAAGIAEGTIYRHFTSKDELAVDLFARNWLAFAAYMERAASRAEAPRARLALMLCWLLSAAERQADLFDYLFIVPHDFAAQVARDVQTPISLLKRELADLVPPGEVELRAAILLGGMREVVIAVRGGRLASPLLAGELLLSSVLLAAPLETSEAKSPADVSLAGF